VGHGGDEVEIGIVAVLAQGAPDLRQGLVVPAFFQKAQSLLGVFLARGISLGVVDDENPQQCHADQRTQRWRHVSTRGGR
jgi:hypothetical protein